MAPPPTAALPGAPPSSRAEYAADAAVHAIGLAAAALACLGLVLAMLGCSAAYNLAGEGSWKPFLQRLDHAAIFVMIAGTYTPITLLAIGGGWGWRLFGVVWAGALGGAALKLLAPARIERAAILLYLLLGWTGLVAIEQLVRALGWPDLALLLVGGLFYSLGVRLHLANWLRFHTALWHGCVLAGAACHYAVVLRIAGAAA